MQPQNDGAISSGAQDVILWRLCIHCQVLSLIALLYSNDTLIELANFCEGPDQESSHLFARQPQLLHSLGSDAESGFRQTAILCRYIREAGK